MPKFNIESLEILNDEFEYCEKLGNGKFGMVYRVICKSTGKPYAAKHVECRRASEKRRIMEEVEILGSINHPQIMRLYRVFADLEDSLNDEIVLLLEYLSGGDLYNRVMYSEKEITERHVGGFIKQVLLGLQHLHFNNIVHLDIKPENIVCERSDSSKIKLVDFGLSRVLNEQIDVCVMQGTPDFVSPEVLNYEPVSYASDMWSVGVITYVLLSGLSPFLGNTKDETFCNITSGSYTLNEEQFDSLSKEARDFIQSLLIVDPEKRMTATDCLSHSWILACESDENPEKTKAKLRWSKCGSVIKAMNRFRGIEKEQ